MQSVWAAKIFGDREDPRARLHAIFGGSPARSGMPPENALTWAREVLERAGVEDISDELRATRELRRAEPRLTLKAATFLARHATR